MKNETHANGHICRIYQTLAISSTVGPGVFRPRGTMTQYKPPSAVKSRFKFVYPGMDSPYIQNMDVSSIH